MLAAVAAVEIQLAETLYRMKMADEQVAVAAAVSETCQTGWVVVGQPFVEVKESQWVVSRLEVAGNSVRLPPERKGSIPVGRSPR